MYKRKRLKEKYFGSTCLTINEYRNACSDTDTVCYSDGSYQTMKNFVDAQKEL